MFGVDLHTLILVLYFSVLSILSLYGAHRYYLIYLYYRHCKGVRKPDRKLEKLPVVTVQLPIFNERYVVERLIRSVCGLNYPKELLEIQVLDDSTDETSRLAAAAVDFFRSRGFDIHYIHRTERDGFKAGALDHGLKIARGELVAIFDADFMPQPETLLKTVHYFSNPRVGMVQVRWGHINRDYSLLTRVQAIMLDGHFILESGTRNRSGRFFNFNGTAGIWRSQAVVDAGGWEHDTLTEDLDLSYRAQMKGWEFVFIPDFTAPAEVPVDMNSFKSQQFRWAKGSIQTCRKLLPRLLRSKLPLRVKVEAFFHLTANFTYPLMTLLSVLLFPALLIRVQHGWLELLFLDLPLFLVATFSITSFYVVSQREIGDNWLSRVKYIPFLLCVGIGLSVNNSRAVLEALLGRRSSFERTPKFCVESLGDDWRKKLYRAKTDFLPLLEILFGLYYLFVVLFSIQQGILAPLPFLLLFMVGYLYTGFLSLWAELGRPRLAQV